MLILILSTVASPGFGSNIFCHIDIESGGTRNVWSKGDAGSPSGSLDIDCMERKDIGETIATSKM